MSPKVIRAAADIEGHSAGGQIRPAVSIKRELLTLLSCQYAINAATINATSISANTPTASKPIWR